ncbi:hypothetical protein C0Q70_04868 [Pomacea canaliculata]|uniref:Uncharacterized protein n=1 Tax=Pomacea canaliculata TaxID=400727 RepID=A0A2T7PJM5_POMCA|nr:hypothetical protein C0Q70_04868 [Pomacea canaliculata]
MEEKIWKQPVTAGSRAPTPRATCAGGGDRYLTVSVPQLRPSLQDALRLLVADTQPNAWQRRQRHLARPDPARSLPAPSHIRVFPSLSLFLDPPRPLTTLLPKGGSLAVFHRQRHRCCFFYLPNEPATALLQRNKGERRGHASHWTKAGQEERRVARKQTGGCSSLVLETETSPCHIEALFSWDTCCCPKTVSQELIAGVRTEPRLLALGDSCCHFQSMAKHPT